MDIFGEIGKIGEFILDPLDTVDTQGIKNFVGDLTGKNAEEAALQGAQLMAEAGQQGIDLTQGAVSGFQAGLSPFQELGMGAIPMVGRQFGGIDSTNPLSGVLGQQFQGAMGGLAGVNPFGDLTGRAQGLFGDTAGSAIFNDPSLMAMQDKISQDIMNAQSARGRAGAAETPGLLNQNLMLNAQNFLSNERSDLLGALTAGESMAAGQRGQLMQGAGLEEQIAQQRRGELMDLLGFGAGISTDIGQAGLTGSAIQTGLLGDIANAQAGGLAGAAGARGQGASNILNTAATIGSMFSDVRLKRNIRLVGKYKDYNAYEYEYIWSDVKHVGVMAQEVEKVNPDAVTEVGGYKMVNYGAL